MKMEQVELDIWQQIWTLQFLISTVSTPITLNTFHNKATQIPYSYCYVA